jgi:hypothetical protein
MRTAKAEDSDGRVGYVCPWCDPDSPAQGFPVPSHVVLCGDCNDCLDGCCPACCCPACLDDCHHCPPL